MVKSVRCWRMGCPNKAKLFAPPRLYFDSMTEWPWVVVHLEECQHFQGRRGRRLTLIFCTMQHMEEFFHLEFERLYTLLLLDEDVACEAGSFAGNLRCDGCKMVSGGVVRTVGVRGRNPEVLLSLQPGLHPFPYVRAGASRSIVSSS